jgi:hypothetical protein
LTVRSDWAGTARHFARDFSLGIGATVTVRSIKKKWRTFSPIGPQVSANVHAEFRREMQNANLQKASNGDSPARHRRS